MKCNSTALSGGFIRQTAVILLLCFMPGGIPFLLAPQRACAQQTELTVTGSVIDKNKETLIGALIRVIPDGIVAQTDVYGRFELRNVSPDAKLQVSYLGMKTATVNVNGRREINVVLDDADNSIGEVVVTGYQDVRRPRMTGSVSMLKSSDIAKMDVRSMDQVLRGTMSGVATSYSGRPGEDVKIRIRGANSITGNTDPIWIVDGMPITGTAPKVSSNDDLQRLMTQTGIGDIAPSDIESITVLKDAAATAIYGARAANGVIVVKTKTGREGKPTYNASLYFGVTERPYSNIRMMNAEEKLTFERNMYYESENNRLGRGSYLLSQVRRGIITQAQADAEIARLSTINTDWFKHLYRVANSQQVNLSMSGGSQRTQYFTSATFMNQNGTELNNNYKRGTFNAKLNHSFTNTLKLQTNLLASYRNERRTGSSILPLYYAYSANPYETPDGYDLSYDMMTSRLHSGFVWETLNVIRELKENTKSSRYVGVTLNAKLDWTTPLKGLTYTSQGALTFTNTSSRVEEGERTYTNMMNNWLSSINEFQELLPSQVRGSLREGQFTGDAFTWRNMLNYSQEINNKHAIEVFAGQEISTTTSYNSFNYSPIYDRLHRIVGYPQLPNGLDMQNLPLELLGGTGKDVSKMSSFFANGTYSYLDKYVFSASARYDGSDIIGNQNQFTPLWNVSGRWNLYKEKFIKSNFINFLSLRVGYGYTGSIDHNALPFVTMTLRDQRLYDNMVVPYTYQQANPNIKWQTKHDFNVGLESTFWENRIVLNVNYYNNKVVDLLDQRSRPLSSGVVSVTENVANLVNRGFEFDLGITPIRTDQWEWTLRGNISFNKNIITKTYYNSLEEVPQASAVKEKSSDVYVKNYSVGAWYGYKFAGIDPATGHTLIYANDGSKFDMDVLSNAALNLKTPTMTYLGERNPTVTGGFSTDLRWRSFDFNATFEFQAGHLIPTVEQTMAHHTEYSGNRYLSDLYRWRTPGDITTLPQLGYRRNAFDSYRYDVSLEKGDYLRCTYLTLGYNLPESLCHKIAMKSARIALSASNLFTLTPYKGIDPVLMGGWGYPSTRSYNLTVNLGF